MTSPKRPLAGEESVTSEQPATNLEVRAAVQDMHDAATCPLGLAINTIGGRWKLHILRALLLGGPRRYNELLALIDGISAKELTRNLRELVNSQLVEHIEIDSARSYALTELGSELEAAFRALGVFGTALAARRSREPRLAGKPGHRNT